MTCIAAIIDQHSKTIHMAGDSALTQNHKVSIAKAPKIFNNQGFLIGSTGMLRTLQLLQHVFIPPDYNPKAMSLEEFMSRLFVDALRICLKESGAATKTNEYEQQYNETLVGFRGRLFVIDQSYAVSESQDTYEAVGCGGEIATGSLFSTEKLRLSPHQRLEIALNAASYHCNSVRSPYSFQELAMSLEELQEEQELTPC